MMNRYLIDISMTPDAAHTLKPYFWCLLKLQNMKWINDGFGWSIDPQQAWEEANECYRKNQTIP